MVLDIAEGCSYPASHLSNFTAYTFIFEDVLCHSMEGLVQSLKYADPIKQKEVCLLVGKEAKFKGKKKKWYVDQTLYWKGHAISRHSKAYQDLLDRMFEALYQNEAFRHTLHQTGNTVITHSMGESHPYRTVLTEEEFCSRLMGLRDEGALVKKETNAMPIQVQVSRDEAWIDIEPREVKVNDAIRFSVIAFGVTVNSPVYRATIDAYRNEQGEWDFGVKENR